MQNGPSQDELSVKIDNLVSCQARFDTGADLTIIPTRIVEKRREVSSTRFKATESPILCKLTGSSTEAISTCTELVKVDLVLPTVYGMLALKEVQCVILDVQVQLILPGQDVIRDRFKTNMLDQVAMLAAMASMGTSDEDPTELSDDTIEWENEAPVAAIAVDTMHHAAMTEMAQKAVGAGLPEEWANKVKELAWRYEDALSKTRSTRRDGGITNGGATPRGCEACEVPGPQL